MIAALLCCFNMALGTGIAYAQEPAEQETVAVPAPEPVPQAPGAGPTAVAYTAPVPTPTTLPRPRRLVFGLLPSLTMGISVIPSANFAVFVGGRLRHSPWVLGYQFTFSSGFAERYSRGWLTHRHHITALRSFAKRGRGFASVGGGAAFMETSPVVEVEGRIGLRFGSKQYGIVAAQVRLGWDIGHREQAPMPQFGVVIGFAVM